MVDDRDPAAHWAMGRALWLRGGLDQSIVELERAIDLSPNFAQGHYALAFVHSQSGDPQAAVKFSDYSRHLSPFDPMLFAMLGARAMALVRLGQFEEAAVWGAKAAARPNAHAHVLGIAAYSLALAGRVEEARTHFAEIRKRIPGYRIDDFLTAMQFAPDGAALFRQGRQARRHRITASMPPQKRPPPPCHRSQYHPNSPAVSATRDVGAGPCIARGDEAHGDHAGRARSQCAEGVVPAGGDGR